MRNYRGKIVRLLLAAGLAWGMTGGIAAAVVEEAPRVGKPVGPRLEAGPSYSLLRQADGTVQSWGSNGSRQLGFGDTIQRNSPGQPPMPKKWQALAAGSGHVMALGPEGSLWAWGSNSYGQLGLGNNTARATPVQMGSGVDWKSVDAGIEHTLAVKADGSLWAWGRNQFGQLGLADNSDRNAPVQVAGDNWATVHAGSYHTLAIKADGTLWAWGRNVDGELGVGDTADRVSPVKVAGAGWVAVAAGVSHTLAIKADGSLWAWGRNATSELGLGDTESRYSPVQVADAGWIAVAAGYDNSLGLKSDGSLWAWGGNSIGQLGLGDTVTRSTPSPVAGSDWVTVAAGYSHSLGLKADGSLWSWGRNNFGQLGLGDTTTRTSPQRIGVAATVPDRNPALRDFGTIGRGMSVGIEQNFTVSNNAEGAFNITAIGVRGPYDLSHDCPVTLAAGNSCIVTVTLKTAAAGNYASGAVAIRTPDVISGEVAIPLAAMVKAPGSPRLAAGVDYSLLRKVDGSLWAWGSSFYGQLGRGDNAQHLSPVAVDEATDWVTLSAGTYHTMAGKDDGSLWAWGRNNYGQLGIGSIVDQNSPVQVGETADWKAVSAGANHTMALKADGTLWAWGYNSSGQLGLGDTVSRTGPVQVGSGNNWAKVSAGAAHTLAIQKDGSLWAWGNNGSNRLGMTGTNRSNPTRVGSDNDWLTVSAGTDHTLAIKADGSLWAWGENTNGQTGLGSVPTQPLQVGEESWAAVSAGKIFTLAIKADGSLWAWGNNSYYQLGLGDQAGRSTPAPVSADTDWVAVQAGSENSHSLARKADGSFWTWGYNSSGQLGLGNTTIGQTPTQIDAGNHVSIEATPAGHDFGTTSRGAIGAGNSFTISNQSGQAFGITRLGVRGPYEVSFNNCPTTLASLTSCLATVTLRTNNVGDFGGALAILSPDIFTGEVAIPLAAAITGSRLTIDNPGPFFTIPAGETATADITLTNTGTDPLDIGSINLAGSGVFSITGNTCGATLDANGGSCTVTVSFSPVRYGNFTGRIEIDTSDPVNPLRKVALRGTGEAPRLKLSGDALFGAVMVGDAPVREVTLANTGNAPLVITGINRFGSVAYEASHNCPGTLAAGSSCTLTATFTPSAVSDYNGRVEIISDELPLRKILLRGTGITP